MRPRPFRMHEVAALFLSRQHLSSPRSAALTARRLVRFAEDVGGIQIDSINVVERAHYLAAWSRFGPYDRAVFDGIVYRRRLLFEYWAHAACLVPTSLLPGWRRGMLDYRVRHTGWTRFLRRNAKVLAGVKAAIEAQGPLESGELEKRRSGSKGWWSWGPARHALHHLWMTGALTVDSRRNFQKRFDLIERAIPAVRSCEPISSEEFARWHVLRSLRAMGAATEKDLVWYLSFPKFLRAERRAALRAVIDRGDVSEIAVEGSPQPWFALTRDLAALQRAGRRAPASTGTTLLSPFDSLLWHRERVARLFGFDYRIEVYTPGHKRVHGYYTMPVLHDGRLIGRIDAKTHRAKSRLEVRHAHFEPWFASGKAPPAGGERASVDAGLEGLAAAIGSLAAFVGANDVALRRVTPARLRRPLARSLGT